MRVRSKSLGGRPTLAWYVIEPGDATRYTILFRAAVDNNGPLVAIGSGDRIEGGYVIPHLRDIMLRLKEAAWNRESMFGLLKEIFVGYWQSHSGVKDEWTCIVALLFAAILSLSELGLVESSNLIKDVYLSNHQGVHAALANVKAL